MIFPLILAVVAAASTAAGIGILALWWFPPQERAMQTSMFGDFASETLFLFDGEVLVDSTATARALLATSPIKGPAWGQLMAFLSARFENLEAQLQRVPQDGVVELTTKQGAKPLILARSTLAA